MSYQFDVQKIYQKAIEYFLEMYASNKNIQVSNILIEKVSIDEYKGVPECWYITIGFNDNLDENIAGLAKTLVSEFLSRPRKYKTIVLTPDGEFKAMLIRKVEYA